ncbi:hypothetical protein QTJ16_006715 [Diplocarpon rosae]|uniref:SWIRM domain-containing protein n=1 Tax=Diplocarpon rosae TaxID=946125 RepID=A0AAD9SUP5_9HELO|nr:hypothetical protein QTJ16_006715 [Diplocarpon rosae]PBP19523.1 SWIRM domain-containing protein [Diplocarpon rosae]
MANQGPLDTPANMLSPPEQPPLDNFPQSPDQATKLATDASHPTATGRRLAPLSPPISPETATIHPRDAPQPASRDPILFPQDHHDRPSSQASLFAPSRLVDDHIRARELSTFRATSPPRADEYELALSFKSTVMQSFSANPRAWAQLQRAQLREDKLAQLRHHNQLKNGGRRYPAIAPAHAGAVRHVRPAPKPSTKAVAGSRVAKTPRPGKPVIRGATPGGEPAKRVAREDKDFDLLQDFCPPLDTLPSKAHSLKVDWKGQAIDLSSDPHAHLLHPDERQLAANLRLDCATYLTSKRRIFIKRIEAYKINKEFRKTDAQQACKIDVNKASKLWQAFEKVGWLDPRYIQQYL